MNNDRIKKKFDDIDGRIDFMIEFCHTLQLDNQKLLLKITELEAELDAKNETEEHFSKQTTWVQSKVDNLLTKLDSFSENSPDHYPSNQ